MNVLIYTPGLAGHLQVYGRVVARALLDAGHAVTLAAPASQEDWPTRWPALRPLAGEPRVRGVDIRPLISYPSGELTAEQAIEIQRDCQADSTLFLQADGFAPQFRRIAAGTAPRLRGRICAIFARTSDWFPGEDAYSGRQIPRIGPTVRATLGRLRQRLFHRRDSLGYFYEHTLLARRTVDALIVKDERIAQHFGPPVAWMPEIYRVFDVRPEERRGADWDRYAEPVRQAIDRAGPDKVLLYFGTGAWYKGYDWFLQLALQDQDAFALHAGAPDRGEPGKPYACDVAAVRAKLLRQGRLFETQAFIESADLVDLLFNRIARFVSTHRLTLSSGTVLQALEAGKSVLTPDSGLVGWRTRQFQLGATYAYGDVVDLARHWKQFQTGRRDADPNAIRAFMDRFSRARTERFFVDLLTGEWP